MTGSRLVYSTSGDNSCPHCHKSLRKCSCQSEPALAITSDNAINLHRQTKGRKGSGVTVITGVSIDTTELKALTKKLKLYCGTGGTVKKGVIEVQGDKRNEIKTFFKLRGVDVKITGS